jgi:hypothetical protein
MKKYIRLKHYRKAKKLYILDYADEFEIFKI